MWRTGGATSPGGGSVATLTPAVPIAPAALFADLFGPVATLYRVGSYEEAVALANATSFGLGSNAWTTDPEEQDRFVDDLEAGLRAVAGFVFVRRSIRHGEPGGLPTARSGQWRSL